MFVINCPGFSMFMTYKSKQSLRWRMYDMLGDISYLVMDGSDAVMVRQHGDRLVFTGDEDSFFDKWYSYFDFETDYIDLVRRVQKVPGFIGHIARQYRGIRMVSVDPWESLLTQCLWCRCDSDTARSRLSNICQAAGKHNKKHYKGLGSIEWDDVPSPDDILDNIDSVKWFTDEWTEEASVSAAQFFKLNSEQMVCASDADELRSILTSSGLLNVNQANRVMRDGYGFKQLDCIPVRFRRQCTYMSECRTFPDWVDWELDVIDGKQAYTGLMLQAMS